MSKQKACRACGEQFDVEVRGQSYCQPCREARAVAAEAAKVKAVRTCPCGQTFEPEHGNNKYCAACREERYNVTHPLKTCAKCG